MGHAHFTQQHDPFVTVCPLALPSRWGIYTTDVLCSGTCITPNTNASTEYTRLSADRSRVQSIHDITHPFPARSCRLRYPSSRCIIDGIDHLHTVYSRSSSY